jgi:hypothetical protein
MSYFIFLKYLKSLEEFRKNPCVQIPPKSPCANFQSLSIFKNSIFIRKEFFFNFRPNRPSGQPAHPAFLALSDQAGRAPPPLPLAPSLTEPAAPPPPPLAPPRHGRRTAPLPRHGATPTDAPLLNSVACLYSVVNPPPIFTACNRRLHGWPLKPPPVPPPPSNPYKRQRPSLGPCHTRPHSPPLLSKLELHQLRAPLSPLICCRCPIVTQPNEPGRAPRRLHRPPLSTPDPPW